MNKKRVIKDFIIYLMLFLIVPIALYINFFFFNLTIWSYEIKAWVIYFLLIIVSEIIVIIISRNLSFYIIRKYKFLKNDLIKDFVHINTLSFLGGNIFLIQGVYRLKIWYYLPIFQGIIIFLFGIIMINKNFSSKSNLSFMKQIFKLEKREDKTIISKYYMMIIIVILYVMLNMISQYIIKSNYNPLNKSLEYYMEGTGYKPNFNKS